MMRMDSKLAAVLQVDRVGDVWELSGDLTFRTVSKHWLHLRHDRPRQNWTLQLRHVQRLDSAGLVFLLDCVRDAETRQVALLIDGLDQPEWQNLMQVHGVKHLLKEK